MRIVEHWNIENSNVNNERSFQRMWRKDTEQIFKLNSGPLLIYSYVSIIKLEEKQTQPPLLKPQWNKSLSGTNVPVEQMSQWGKCFNGTNVTPPSECLTQIVCKGLG